MSDTPDQPEPNPQPQAAPGWYPTSPGVQGYWDGSAWTGHTAPMAPASSGEFSDDKTLAIIAHLLPFVAGFIGPLVLYLIKKDESPYVRHHAAEALNFQLTVMIAMIVSFILILVLVGILMIMVVGIGALVLSIVAAVAASRGEWYRYPMTIRFVT